MYYPIQIPYILSPIFKEHVSFEEEIIPEFEDFVICFWETKSISDSKEVANNIIIPDGCIDLIVDYQTQQIGFSGMSQTDFHYEIINPANFIGARLKPGAFYQLTGIPATEAMDNFLSLSIVDPTVNYDDFFQLDPTAGKSVLKKLIEELSGEQKPGDFIQLFDELFEADSVITVNELAANMSKSMRQTQRLFLKHYGLTPKMILSVIRFQRSLEILLDIGGSNRKPADIDCLGYYDQPHLIKEIKKNIGITPVELLKNYQKD
ncbi:helix-turn-helix domain-containing protein [Carnobacterium maltaromaticum]|jgi:AraC-like DNA-binding protein|uniref:helix-turn-helix domain-containing protein n=1 Tax=Carnobacterium maltaromaticum TaxID=2751 RepID=UPI000E71ED60|nr:DUF6597 domain-containing transcriptional factor [Carnobacterium maltaromaticum]AOA02609.1 AraC family transcriptional regulator [Carnobacterium maltaromaticum]MCI1820585.1 helix-turn-helix domain-containing protein [Carnobacterium maltaromaticum]